MFEIVTDPIDPRRVEAAVAHPGAGAVLTFAGTTRDSFEGRRVVGLSYEAFAEMAVPEMRAIADRAVERWPGVRVAMVHRIGEVPVGEASVVISVSAPHRGPAYDASRFAIDALKERVPVWKKERYEDGSTWKQNAEFHGEDA